MKTNTNTSTPKGMVMPSIIALPRASDWLVTVGLRGSTVAVDAVEGTVLVLKLMEYKALL